MYTCTLVFTFISFLQCCCKRVYLFNCITILNSFYYVCGTQITAKMSDSDSESYEVIDERFSPPARNFTPKPRSFTHTGMVNTRRSSSHSPVPLDIDSRPPFPIPKSAIWGGQNNSGFLTYDRITVSPVAPDYETTSSSPPRHLSNGHLHSPNGFNPPPLPPINPHRKPPTRLVFGCISHFFCLMFYLEFELVSF